MTKIKPRGCPWVNTEVVNHHLFFPGAHQVYSPTGFTECYDDVVPEATNEVVVTTEDSETSEEPEPEPNPAPELQTLGEQTSADVSIEEVTPLDPEILKALGEATDTSPEFGPEIHKNLVQLWSPILKKGLSKETKETLLKEYLVPTNCKLLQSPKLNPEMTAAVTDLCRNRDKKMATSQQQLGVATTAIGRAFSILLNADEKTEKIKAIKHLSDGCRLLCDLHFQDTSCRIKLVTPNLDQSFCKLIQDVERDDTLFGEKLSEKIKASKAITRQGLQIKKPVNPKPSTSQLASGRPANAQGNWTGPPRSSNRGGRGGSRRPFNNMSNYNNPRGPTPSQHLQQQHQQQPQSNSNNRQRGQAPQRR